MTMDVGVSSRSGVQLETSLYTSTGGKVNVVVKQGEVIEMDLNLPKRKTHLLQFKLALSHYVIPTLIRMDSELN